MMRIISLPLFFKLTFQFTSHFHYKMFLLYFMCTDKYVDITRQLDLSSHRQLLPSTMLLFLFVIQLKKGEWVKERKKNLNFSCINILQSELTRLICFHICDIVCNEFRIIFFFLSLLRFVFTSPCLIKNKI